MPGHIGTGIRDNSLKVQTNTDMDGLNAAQHARYLPILRIPRTAPGEAPMGLGILRRAGPNKVSPQAWEPALVEMLVQFGAVDKAAGWFNDAANFIRAT